MHKQTVRKEGPAAKIVAKLVMTYRDGHQLIVEVHENPGYSDFYRWYRREGKKRKTLLRTSSRELKVATDLETVQARQLRAFGKDIVEHKIVILRKRLYRKLINCSSDALPGGKGISIHSTPYQHPVNQPVGRDHAQPVHIPVSGYTPLARRFQILTGKAGKPA
jgi:hypothetical protein